MNDFYFFWDLIDFAALLVATVLILTALNWHRLDRWRLEKLILITPTAIVYFISLKNFQENALCHVQKSTIVNAANSNLPCLTLPLCFFFFLCQRFESWRVRITAIAGAMLEVKLVLFLP